MLAGCPGDDSGQSSDTEPDDSSTSDDDNSNSNSEPTADTTVSSTMTEPSTSMSTMDTTLDTSSDGPCTGVCEVDEDCAPGQSCIECLCLGEPTGCEMWGEGSFSDCVNDEGMIDNSVCGGTDPVCLVDNTTNPTAGACLYQGCKDPCDCPPPPVKGFEALVACAQVGGDEQLDCFLDCSEMDCPDGMFCSGGTCLWGDEPEEIPPYGDCLNLPGACADMGTCVSDMDATLGWCANACADAEDDDSCPAAPKGEATPDCVDVNGPDAAGGFFCALNCTDGACPEGMTCLMGNLPICIWEPIVEPVPGYGDCANSSPDVACLETETCADGAEGSVCTSDCAMADECALAPATGDAPVACGDIGGGMDQCYLDCAADQDCPDHMECVAGAGAVEFCQFPALDIIFEEDFEGGALPKGWTLHDEDGLNPDPMVSFVDAAWVVTDELEPAENNAAYSTSWYMPAGVSDDWLVTPEITLGAASQLRWEAFTPNANFPDGYEVLVSTTGSDVADFTDAPVFTIAAEAIDYTPHQVDLSAYADEAVYIAFRNITNDGVLLVVDNIQVGN